MFLAKSYDRQQRASACLLQGLGRLPSLQSQFGASRPHHHYLLELAQTFYLLYLPIYCAATTPSIHSSIDPVFYLLPSNPSPCQEVRSRRRLCSLSRTWHDLPHLHLHPGIKWERKDLLTALDLGVVVCYYYCRDRQLELLDRPFFVRLPGWVVFVAERL
jgi:hypothetical protein